MEFILSPPTTHYKSSFSLSSYAAYNYSAPRLPVGLKFSKTLRAVTNMAFQTGLYTSDTSSGSVMTYWWV